MSNHNSQRVFLTALSTAELLYSAAPLYSAAMILLLLLGAGLRLYDLTDQPIDFHPTRQLRGAIVARSIYYQFQPDADASTRKTAIAFGESVGQYEPPILESLVAFTYLIIGGEQLWIARIYNTLFWIIAGIALFLLARRMAANQSRNSSVEYSPAVPYANESRSESRSENRSQSTTVLMTAAIVLAYYLILPFSVQASRSFQPDPGMVMWMVLFAYTLYRWSEERCVQRRSWIWAILAGLTAGIAVVTKAIAVYPVAITAIFVVLHTFSAAGYCLPPERRDLRSWAIRFTKTLLACLKSPQVWGMAILMAFPSAAFYLGREDRASEYFYSWTVALAHLLTEPWLYLRWLNLLVELLGIVPLLLGLAGVILVCWRPASMPGAASPNRALLLGLWLGYILYGLTLPYQMYTHTYYQLQVIPILALSMLPTIHLILEQIQRNMATTAPVNTARAVLSDQALYARLTTLGITALGLILIAYYSWIAIAPMRLEDFSTEPAYWQHIAAQIPTDGKVMALTQDYGYRLMYYGWRKVSLWPNRGEQRLTNLRGSEKEFETYFAKHTEGKTYFLITAFRQFEDQPDLKQYLYDHYPLVAEGKGYLIFKLQTTP